MARSMTGWGSCRAKELSVNLRGVNSKYKEVILHLPQDFFEAEAEIYRFLNTRIDRGRVDVYVNVVKENDDAKVKFNRKLFMKAYNELKSAFRAAKIKQEVPAASIISNVQGVLGVENSRPENDFSWKKIMPVFEKALRDFEKMKEREGERLSADILDRAVTIEKQADAIKELFEKFRADYSERTRKKLEQVMGEEKKGFVGNAVVEIIDKYDITEETVRIASHIKQLKNFLAGKNASGRKIDFLAQELYREANTIASKIPDAPVAHAVITIKECTDKIREQAQNLE